MNNQPALKVCGIMDPTVAYHTAQLGVDFIGIIFHPTSIRSVTLEQAIPIAAAVRASSCEAVAVLVNANAEEISKICLAAHINIVQLHGNIARAQQKFLSDKLRCIYVIEIDQHGMICNDDLSGVHLLNPEKDFLLLDYKKNEPSTSVDLTAGITLSKKLHLPFFVAGGIHPQNVRTIIQNYQPHAIDVASGVECTPGVKDMQLIRSMVNTIKGSI